MAWCGGCNVVLCGGCEWLGVVEMHGNNFFL